ncbi:MAG: hypothetical protein AAB225_04855 [Acidobacteriota bacterium]|mgnify:CR=1 FL=1
MTQQEIIDALRANVPFSGLEGVCVDQIEPLSAGPLDVTLKLEYGGGRVTVYGKIKNACTPKLVQEIAPWLFGMKMAQQDAAFALICPAISAQAQSVCAQNKVDFIGLDGNVSINVAGKFFLQRVGLKNKPAPGPALYGDPFSPKGSRVLRVLLQRPGDWTLKAIAQELERETERNTLGRWDFRISLAAASKTVSSLEQELLVRRRGVGMLLPEPGRLLLRWAEKYKERYRWYLRRSFKAMNPFGEDLRGVAEGLRELTGSAGFAFTGAAAAAVSAPFVDLETIDVFVEERAAGEKLRTSAPRPGAAPGLRVIYPYDIGVFMYGAARGGIPCVSDVQAFLDLYARGGRDMKQADYLLANVIEPRWGAK